MPTTRKSTRGSAAKGAAIGKQSTLSFNNRVSKAGAAKAVGKDKDANLDSPFATPPPSKKVKVERPEEPEEPEEPEAQVEDKSQTEVVEEPTQVAEAEGKGQAEARAEKITDAQIRKYWKGVEEARISRRVHQEELGTGEKVLRYFDISSQYGPCIGIPRMKRWYRAERLGMHPPIEVLAVLLKEKSKTADVDRSAMDRLMSSTAIGSL